MRTGKLLFCLLCSLIATNGFSQNVRDLMQSFNEYTAAHPVEKIYLHLDKPYYAAGEYMYFRAYLTDIDLNQNAVESHIIYVELSDERKEIVKRTLLYSDSTEYAGQFLLPDSLPSANYHLRAYTNWMRNAGEDYFYHRDIYIGHPTDKKEIKAKPFDYEVAFFPEGGQLLQGMTNKVAFKALGNDGFGTNIAGILKDETGNEILRFHSTHLGMGSFALVPESGKKYIATVESKGRSKEYSIPSAVNGMGLSIEQTPDSIRLTIRSTESSSTAIRVIAQSRHTICYALTGQCQDKEQIVLIPKDKFPTGITQFTLFKDNQPMSERLAFIDQNDNLRITITPDKEKYSDRDKVELAITVTDKDGNPVEGSFSLAVTDDKVVTPSIHTENIKGSILLDSDLKGFIEQPGWYFDGDEPERQEALDNLLCTQGWTRYIWNDIKRNMNDIGARYPVEQDLRLTGRMINITGKPIPDGDILLFGSGGITSHSLTDKNGAFSFDGLVFPDTTAFILQGRTKKGRRTFLDVKLDAKDNKAQLTYIPTEDNLFPEYINTLTISYVSQTLLQKKFENNMWNIQLPVVEVKSSKKRKEDHDRLFQNLVSHKITREEVNENLSIKMELPRLMRRFFSRMESPIIILDGVETDDLSIIEECPVLLFDIEIFRGAGASIYGARGSGGAIVINMRSPSDIQKLYGIEPPGMVNTRPEGYCIRKNFYVPAYDKPDVKQNPTPDRRTTIYWSPVLMVDKGGKGYAQFYAADNVSSYSYVLEGIAANQLGFTKKFYPPSNKSVEN